MVDLTESSCSCTCLKIDFFFKRVRYFRDNIDFSSTCPTAYNNQPQNKQYEKSIQFIIAKVKTFCIVDKMSTLIYMYFKREFAICTCAR